MKVKFAIAAVFLLVFPISLFCQVEIKGQVSYGDTPLGQVAIEVKSNGKLRKSVLADKKGRYGFFIPFDEIFEITFSKAGMFPATIVVNTQIPKEKKGIYDEYIVPFNMKLFYYYPETGFEELKGPLGKISFNGEGRESFQFTGDRKLLASYDKAGKKSHSLYASGKTPVIYHSSNGDKPSKTANAETELQSQVKAKILNDKLQENERRDSAVIAKNMSTALRISVAAEEEKGDLVEARESKESTGAIAFGVNNDQYSGKEVKLDVIELQQKEAEKQKIVSEIKQSAMDDLYGLAYAESKEIRKPLKPPAEVQPVEITVSKNWLQIEEKLVVKEGPRKVEYKAVESNLLFYKDMCYWKNGAEITAHDYQKVKKLFERPNGRNL